MKKITIIKSFMKYVFKKLFVAIVFFLVSKIVLSQERTDGNYLFKIWLFIEKPNITVRNSNKFSIKDSSLFDFYIKNIGIRADTIKNKSFSNDYVFLSVGFSNNRPYDSSIIINRDIKGDSASYFLMPNNCDSYILCVNKSTGISYRLKGFRGNDFFSFLKDVQQGYHYLYKENLSDKDFLNKYTIEGLDFKCIYEGLKISNPDMNRYPCLKICDYKTVSFPAR